MPAVTDVERRTYEIIARFFKTEPAELTPETRFREDLGADSLDLLLLLFELEQESGVSIPDQEAAAIETLGAAVRYVVDHVTRWPPAVSAPEGDCTTSTD